MSKCSDQASKLYWTFGSFVSMASKCYLNALQLPPITRFQGVFFKFHFTCTFISSCIHSTCRIPVGDLSSCKFVDHHLSSNLPANFTVTTHKINLFLFSFLQGKKIKNKYNKHIVFWSIERASIDCKKRTYNHLLLHNLSGDSGISVRLISGYCTKSSKYT